MLNVLYLILCICPFGFRLEGVAFRTLWNKKFGEQNQNLAPTVGQGGLTLLNFFFKSLRATTSKVATLIVMVCITRVRKAERERERERKGVGLHQLTEEMIYFGGLIWFMT